MLILIVTIAFALVIILLQRHFFKQTKNNISKLKFFFPNLSVLKLKEISFPSNVLRSADKLEAFLKHDNIESLSNMVSDDEEVQTVSIISIPKNIDNPEFADVIFKTNLYLCKNVGTTADYELLKNICEHDIDILDDQIHNTLNAPLYLGLAGTFIGIIGGLLGVDINELFSGNITDSGFQTLLWGVAAAMVASLCGLGMTVYNTVYSYKESVKDNDLAKEKYFDFLRRELMPVLSNSMASSLSSLRSVLGHFVDSFGKNLDHYADSAKLLNDNLENQHKVLEEINKLSLTRTATKIAETFVNLKDAADKLEIFKQYQESLNTTMNQVESASRHIGNVIEKFDDFNANLKTVIDNQSATIDLQQQFKASIETHFPSGSEGREVWRREFDLLIEDSKKVTKNLNEQLVTSTQYIQNFVEQNQTFFDTFSQMETVLNTMRDNSRIQSESYTGLQKMINQLSEDLKQTQKETIEVNKALKEEIIKLIEREEETRRKQEASSEKEVQCNTELMKAISLLSASVKESMEKSTKENNELVKAIKELSKQSK